ncbi:hypothetical protein [Streptomyces sp. NPDC047841]|uniref:hypothetical protein n=1 Tax=Streptomyces sp. NPDC047841 TaxID=3154708 RepID=UPI00345152C2
MKKLMRPAAVAATAVLAAGALFCAGGSAAAATLPPGRHLPAEVTVAAGTTMQDPGRVRFDHGYRNGHWSERDRHVGAYTGNCRLDDRFYPWIADQLTLFPHAGDLARGHGLHHGPCRLVSAEPRCA